MISNNTKIKSKNPYPGIRSFEIEESNLFYGREKQVEELSSIIKKTHFIAITGASGSGKSSLVKAGLIPSLIKNTDNWDYLIFRPGSEPIKNMTNAFTEMLIEHGIDKKEARIIKKNEKLLSEYEASLSELLKEINYNKNLLIYIDQFEEIFRFRSNEFNPLAEKHSENFINLMIDIANQREIPAYVIMTLRSDFLGDCTEFPRLPEMVNKGHYLIPRMTLEEKERAITKPAEHAGAKISEDFSQQLKIDVSDKKVGLPVLQHSLMQTWEYWLLNADIETPIDTVHYDAIGTVTNALSVHAEMIYESLNDDNSRKITEKVFKALTYLGEDNRGIRNPTSLGDICKITKAHKMDVTYVIEQFRADGNSFLLPNAQVPITNETIIDISHESIMRVWKRLVTWVDEESKSAQTYVKLSRSAELFQHGKTGLLINPDLQLALTWRAENNPNEVWANRYDPAFDRVIAYLDYSKKEYDKKLKAKAEQQKNKLRRARFIALFLGTASLISILFLIVAMNLRFKAEKSEKDALEKEKIALKQSKIAETQRKEAVSQKRIAGQQQSIAEQQRLLAEEQKKFAVKQQNEAIYQKGIALNARNEALTAKEKAQRLQKEAEILKDRAIEQKKRAEEQKERAEISEAKTDTMRRLAVAKTLAIQSVIISQNNKKAQNVSNEQKKLPYQLALTAYDFTKKYNGNVNNSDLFAALSENAQLNKVIRGKNSHSQSVRSITTAGQKFISTGDDGKLIVHKINNINDTWTLNSGRNSSSIRSAGISKDNKVIVGANYKGEILVWDATQANLKPKTITAHKSVINKVIFLKKRNAFVTISNDGTARAWDGTTPTVGTEFFAGSASLTVAEENLSGEYIAIANTKGDITIFRTEDFSKVKTVNTKGGEITSLMWNTDNDLNIGYESGKMMIRKAGEKIKEVFAHSSRITGIIYDKKTNRLITSSYDGTIKIWNYSNFDIAPIKINAHNSWINAIAISADGKYIISGSDDKSIKIFNIDISSLKAAINKKVTQNMSKYNWLRFVGEGIDYIENIPK